MTQVILEQLREIRKQIVELRDEMRVRFDRIEKRLNKIYVGILSRLAEMDFDLGQIEGNVDELQLSLYDLHSELQRLNRNVHAFLEAAHRRELVEAINFFLRFRERTGEDLSLQDFRAAENRFFSWGNDHAKDVLQAGPEDRSFTDEDLLEEVTALPLATNVNYLRRFPAERFGLAPLSAVRLANPFDWIVAGEAYAQLCEESPARTVSPARVQSLVAVGEALGRASRGSPTSRCSTPSPPTTSPRWPRCRRRSPTFEGEFRVDPDTQLQGIDLWGGVDQEPATHPLDSSFDELRRCDGRNFDASHDTVPVPASIGSAFDYSILRPYMIASNLSRSVVAGVADGLAGLTACVAARWDVQESSPARQQGPGGLPADDRREHPLRRRGRLHPRLPHHRDDAAARPEGQVRERHVQSGDRSDRQGSARSARRRPEPVGEAGHVPGNPRARERAAAGRHRRAPRSASSSCCSGRSTPRSSAASRAPETRSSAPARW